MGSDTLVMTIDLDETAVIPTISGAPWVEPRRYGPDGPRWDSTDEIYITYNEEGERAIVTTGQEDIWNTEHSYQRTGSPKYAVLKGLTDRAVGIATVIGDRARRPRSADPFEQLADHLERDASGAGGADGDEPPVHPDRHRYRPWRRSGGRTRDRVEDHRTGSDGAARHLRDRAERSGLPERSDAGFQHEPRSHRHCPGCSGHSGTNRSGWILAFRAVVGWLLGYSALAYGLHLPLSRYAVLTVVGALAAFVFRPVWREWTHAEDRRIKGGRGPRD